MKKKILALFIFSLVFAGLANAQFQITNTDAIPDVKKSMTYVVMPDSSKADFSLYKAIFKAYWTFTPVKFITEKEVEGLQDGDANFFSYERIIVTVGAGDYYVMDQCKLWIYREKLPAITLDIIHPHEMPVALLALSTVVDFYTNPGFQKNALQFFTALLKDGHQLKPTETEVDDGEIGNLKTDTLYIPEEFLHNRKSSKVSSEDSANYALFSRERPLGKDIRYTEEDIKSAYPYPIKITSLAKLNNLILTDTAKAHYYFWLTQGETGHYICVMNSRTGNQLYVAYHGSGLIKRVKMYSLGELKDLAKEIGKAK